MERTIEHERTTTGAVKQLRNDLKDEKVDHEDKVGFGEQAVCRVLKRVERILSQGYKAGSSGCSKRCTLAFVCEKALLLCGHESGQGSVLAGGALQSVVLHKRCIAH